MNKTCIYFAFIFSCLSLSLMAQEEKWEPDPSYFDNTRHREILMNLTPMVSQFVPFNASTVSKLNIFDFEVRRLKNGKGTHFGLGINIDASFNTAEPNAVYLRYGFIKSKQISPHLHFTRSWDANLVVEDTDNNSIAKGKIGFNGLAISYSAGLQYVFSRHIALSTEGTLFLGLLNANTGVPKFKFIPPVGLFLHVKL